MNVTASASRPRTSTGPPFERLYAVEPVGVAQIMPSHGTVPRSSPPTAQPSSTIRPSVELVTTTSLTATCRPPFRRTSRVGSSTAKYSPSNTRSRPRSRSPGEIEARKPTRPKFTPITGTPLPSSSASVRSIVPSPPSATTSSASRGSSTSCTPARSATARTRSTASFTSTRPCVTTAAVLTSRERCIDPLFEVIGKRRVVGVREVEEELPVALGARKPGVYDSGGARPPGKRSGGDLAQHPGAHGRVADDAALADVAAPRLELGLHEHDRLPARRCELQRRRQRHPHGDERHVADDELRCERQL